MPLSINIEGSFEVPSNEEWDSYIATEAFESMRIAENAFESFKDNPMLYPRLIEILHGHNNKIGSVEISYVLCRHYYDKGIPDERWYISPGKDGQSVQYDPDFSEEHYMRRYWFNHFSANLYLSFFSIWDNIIELLNVLYDLGFPSDQRQRGKVMDWLKSNKQSVYAFLDETRNAPVYIEANSYRTAFVHGIAPSEVSHLYPYKKKVTAKVPDMVQTLKTGKYAEKEIKNATVLTFSVGQYTPVRKVIDNIEQFAAYSGKRIQELISLLLSQQQTGDLIWQNLT